MPLLGRLLDYVRQAVAVATSTQISLVSAGCAFYAMLALFPAISLLVALYGLMFDPATVEPQLDLLEGMVPEGGQDLIAGHVHDLVAAPRASLEWAAVVAGVIAFWSASAGIRAMLGALNMAHGQQERRGTIAFYATALMLTLGAIVAVTVGLAFLVALPKGLQWLGFPPLESLLLRGLGLVLMLAMVLIAVGILYRFGPARPPPGWRLVSVGSVTATLLWAFASVLFSLYVSNFAGYDALYGNLGAAVGLMMWFYVSVYVILLGAELDAAIRRERRR
jgi:membrane protein